MKLFLTIPLHLVIIVGRAWNETGGNILSAKIMTEAFHELSPARGNMCNQEPPDSEMKKKIHRWKLSI